MSSSTPTITIPGFEIKPAQSAYYDEQRQAWQVFRYREVQRVLSDYSTFTSQRSGRFDPTDPGTNFENMVMYDPPKHTKMRGLMNQAFTPRTVTRMEPYIRTLTNQLIDAVIARGTMDIVEDFAVPLPLMVIAEMLGVPEDLLPEMRQITDAISEFTTEESVSSRERAFQRFAELIAQRRAEPRDDLISALVQAEEDGYRLTDSEVNSYCVGLILAGNESVRYQLANMMLCFEQFPEALAEVRADLSLLPGALEECMRYAPSVPQFPRIAAVDTTIDGQQVRAGEWVMPWIASANHDPEVFAHPEVFDIRRNPNRHLTFGYGPHYCIGAALTRLEVQIAFEILLNRLSEIRLDQSQPLKPMILPLIFGYKHVPVTFEARS